VYFSCDGEQIGQNYYGTGDTFLNVQHATNSWYYEGYYWDTTTNTCTAPAGTTCGHWKQVLSRAAPIIDRLLE